jgi:MFS family permease
VRDIPTHDRGTALGVYTAFVDLSLGISGPIAGLIVFALGYPPIFLFAAATTACSIALLLRLYRKSAGRSSVADAPVPLNQDKRLLAAGKNWPVLSARDGRVERRAPDLSLPPPSAR